MTKLPRGRGPANRRTTPEDSPPSDGQDTPIVDGTVTEALPHAMYAVQLHSGQKILARVAGTLQMRATRINPGDRVTIELSPYDFSRGRITHRQR